MYSRGTRRPWAGVRHPTRPQGSRHHKSTPYTSITSPLGAGSLVTLPVLRTQGPGPVLTPYGRRCSGQIFTTPNRGTTSETDSLGVSGLVDCFRYTYVTVTSLTEGVQGPYLDHSSDTGWSWCLV